MIQNIEIGFYCRRFEVPTPCAAALEALTISDGRALGDNRFLARIS